MTNSNEIWNKTVKKLIRMENTNLDCQFMPIPQYKEVSDPSIQF